MDDYSDIINLDPPKPEKRMPMTLHDRAAQFAPFAALTGFGAAITETARLTERTPVLSEEEAAMLNEQLRWLSENIKSKPETKITFFVPDLYKEGGSYRTVRDSIKRVDYEQRLIKLSQGLTLDMAAVTEISIL